MSKPKLSISLEFGPDSTKYIIIFYNAGTISSALLNCSTILVLEHSTITNRQQQCNCTWTHLKIYMHDYALFVENFVLTVHVKSMK